MSEPSSPSAGATAGDLARSDVPHVAPSSPVDEVRRLLADGRHPASPAAAVVEGDRFLGLVALERLALAPADGIAADLMDARPAVVSASDPGERAAWIAAHDGATAVCVLDDDDRFVGVIPAATLLAVLLAEHEQDLSRLSGFLRGSAGVRLTSRERVSRRYAHRLPWLLLGLAGAMLSALVVSRFEVQLQNNVALAFFLPAVVYMADAVGTQTETLVIRGLSVGVKVREIVRREAVTGLLIGATIAVLAFVVEGAFWGDGGVGLVLGLSLFVACSIATTVAVALPWGLQQLNQDPAYGSGPIATVIQDLASIAVYFGVAVVVL